MPVVQRKSRSRGPLYWEHEGNKTVRDGKWKLVSKFPDQWELFDMEAERTERYDLSSAQPDRAKKMATMWITGQRSLASSHGLCPGRLQGSG